MISMFRTLICVALIASFMPVLAPTLGHAQDDKKDSTERAHRKAVVKKDWNKTKNGVNNAYHKAKHAPGKAVHKLKKKHQEHEAKEGETK
jgi:hypothetical protein